jgi:TP901 family phage tail tape measure protein
MAKRIEIAIVGNSAPFERALSRSSLATKSFGAQVSGALGTAAKLAGVALGGMGVAAVKSAIDFESSFAGVRKTVEATPEQFDAMARSLRNMAKEIPANVNDLNRIAESAGALGIQRKNIVSFTRTIADMGETTNLVGEEAASSMARLANITRMPQTEFRRLGSTIVDLGNKGASTEAEIAAMGLRLAAAGTQAGMSLPDILGFANAMSSVGIEAEAGGSAMSRVFASIGTAVASGGKNLEGFAQVAGMSSAQFQKAFKEDAAGTVVSFIEGLDRIKQSGGNVYDTLKTLDLNDLRVKDALLRAAGAGDLLRESIRNGNTAWMEGTALQEEAAKRYETTAAQLTILKNRAIDLGISFGQAVVPHIVAAIPHVERFGEKLSSWGPEAQKAATAAGTALRGVGTVAQSSVGEFGIVATASSLVFAGAMSKMIDAWRKLQLALATANPVFLAITVGVGLAAAALYNLATRGDGASLALQQLKGHLDALKASSDAARDTQLSLAEAKNRLKLAAVNVSAAIKAKQQAEASAGQGSLAYKQANAQVEAAYLARRRAALDVEEAEKKHTAATREATRVSDSAKNSVAALEASLKANTAAGHEYQRTQQSGTKVTKELQDQLDRQSARRYATEMRELGEKAATTARQLQDTDPALAKVASGIAKAATANAKFAEETGKIPTTISKVSGPAASAMQQVGTTVAGAASTAGVGEAFATGVGAGIAANLGYAAAQAEALVLKANAAARAAAQAQSPSRLTAVLGRDFVEGFILGITEKTPALKGKVTQAVVDSLQAARDRVGSFQSVFGDAFGKLGEFASRAFEAKTQQLLDKVAAKFDRQISRWKGYADAMTPAEKELAALDAAEDRRSRAAALRTAQDALEQAEAMEEGVEREKAIAAAKEQIRQAELANRRFALQQQAETERAAREQEAAEHIAKLEAAKQRELQNLEERRRQLGEKLDEQLATLQERLSKHPEEYDKIQKRIQALLRSYGIPMQASGKLLGQAFAKGLDDAADEVAKSAKKLAQIVEKYLRLRSPAEAGPMRDLNRWWEGLAPSLTGGIDYRAISRAAERVAATMTPGAFGSARMVSTAAGFSGADVYATATRTATDTQRRDPLLREVVALLHAIDRRPRTLEMNFAAPPAEQPHMYAQRAHLAMGSI